MFVGIIEAIVIAILVFFGQGPVDRLERFVQKWCPEATQYVEAAGGVVDAVAQIRAEDPNVTVQVLPGRVIQFGRELCTYFEEPAE